MNIQSVRELKLELAAEVFAPIASELRERAQRRLLRMPQRSSPLQRVALGIGKSTRRGEFSLAVRLQGPNANGGTGLSYANHLPRIMTALDIVSM